MGTPKILSIWCLYKKEIFSYPREPLISLELYLRRDSCFS